MVVDFCDEKGAALVRVALFYVIYHISNSLLKVYLHTRGINVKFFSKKVEESVEMWYIIE